jgi:hypothetical protein
VTRRRKSFVIVSRNQQVRTNVSTSKKEDLVRKLVQIQEQARVTMDELPATQKLARDRLKLIVGLAGYIATAIHLVEQPALVGHIDPQDKSGKLLQ